MERTDIMDGQQAVVAGNNPINAFTMGGLVATPGSPSSSSASCCRQTPNPALERTVQRRCRWIPSRVARRRPPSSVVHAARNARWVT
jgi:hypothetical protein